MSGMQLLPLDCPSCGSTMHGDPVDILFLCEHCRAGSVLTGEQLEPVEATAILPAPGRHARIWWPAWLLVGTWHVTNRVRADGMSTPPESGERTWVIPAFDMPLPSLTRLAQALTMASGTTGEVPAEPVRGGTLDREDAITLVRHLLIGDEVRRPDMLASVHVTVEIRESRLAATPFEDMGDGRLRCAVTGVKLRRF